MTNAQKWVAAFLVLFVLLFLLSKVTEKDETIIEDIDFYEGNTEQSSDLDGEALAASFTCTSCHGQDFKGTALGPTLYGVKEHWSRDKLINYLRNPSSYSGDDRFDKYKEQFSNSVMPSYNNKDVKDLGKIADFLLTLE